MIDEKYFFDNYPWRPLSPMAVGTLQEIHKHYAEDEKYRNLRQLAYVIATAFHESAHTFNPGIREYGRGRGRRYGMPHPITGQIYYGRGLPQLTWYDNYLKMGGRQKVNMVKEPDIALEKRYSVGNLMIGMVEGLFTGAKLSWYFDDDTTDWVGARRIVNGSDRDNLIGGYAKKIYECLRYTDESYAADNANDKVNEENKVSIIDLPVAKLAVHEYTNPITGLLIPKVVEMPDTSIVSVMPLIENLAA